MTFDLFSGACNNMRMTRGATELLILLCMILEKVQITKGSVSYLSSPCFSTSIGGIGGPARAKCGILAKGMVMGSIPAGDAVTVRHSRGTLSMREMSLWFSIIGLLQPQ